MEEARGRTRRLISDAMELKPTLAPWSYRALAMPQAIEWSLATPKTSAFLPLSKPSRSQSSFGLESRRLTRGLATATAVGTSTAAAAGPAAPVTASGCEAAAASDGSVNFMGSLLGCPNPVATRTLLVSEKVPERPGRQAQAGPENNP